MSLMRNAAFALLALCALPPAGLAKDAPAPMPDFSHFPYQPGAPLQVKQVSTRVQHGVTVEDITYMGTNGDTVPATLVIPKGRGKFAGILWGHWLMAGAPNANRSEFLDEAVALAPAGVISLLIDAPQARPDFKLAPGGFFGPQGPELVAQQVTDLRRGLDLLLSRPDVDAARMAYAGHSFDSLVGAILDATDKRFAAFVFMGGPQLDFGYAEPYERKLGPAPAFFQYGLHDKLVPVAAARQYLALATGPKTVTFYDAGHGLNDKARIDRDRYLEKVLNLKP